MAELRNGMWVRTTAGIGIWVLERVAVSAGGARRLISGAAPLQDGEHVEREAWVHLTNKDGTTLAQIPAVNAGTIEQAARDDIPAERIAHLTEERLRKARLLIPD